MGVFEKIKNALFEVEYVEVDENEKEKKKDKPKIEDNSTDKPIAKKIVLPGRREEKIKRIQEEELVDQNFESRPRDELVKETEPQTFKYVDDADLMVEDEPVIIRNIDEVELLDDSNIDNSYVPEIDTIPPRTIDIPTSAYRGVSPIQNDLSSITTIDNAYKIKERESRPYGMDPSYRVSIKEYGLYDNKDDKNGFRPSPIISPIYGILDKNYNKEDVVFKKEVRLTSNYSRKNMNVDDIRNKAYGKEKEESTNEEVKEDIKEEKEEAVEDNLMVDLSDEKEKPEVKQLTVGDAMEYFQDLGLEYNVDYVDASNKVNNNSKDNLENDIESKMEESTETVEVPVVEDEKEVSPVEVKNEKNDEVLDDDNLFDLIDSMYKDN